MVDPRGTIPGSPNVPFHIGVVGENVAVDVERKIVLVPVAVAEHLKVLTVRIDLCDVTARRENSLGVSIGIPEAREQVIFRPRFLAAHMVDDFRRFGVIARVEVDRLSIRRKLQAVRAMLAAPDERYDELVLVKLAVPRGVGETMDALLIPFVHHGVQAAKRIQEPVRPLDVHIQRLHFRGCFRIRRIQRSGGHPVKSAVLVSANQASLRIHRHGNPRTLLELRHPVEQFDFEVFRNGDVGRRRHHRRVKTQDV